MLKHMGQTRPKQPFPITEVIMYGGGVLLTRSLTNTPQARTIKPLGGAQLERRIDQTFTRLALHMLS